MGVSLSQKDLDAVLKRVDVDGHEAISIEELQVLFIGGLAVGAEGYTGQQIEQSEGRNRARGDESLSIGKIDLQRSERRKKCAKC